MNDFKKVVIALSRWFNNISAIGIVAITLLVVINILMRVILKQPISGTYEYVSFLTACVIGLSLAFCAVQNGHIAISYFVDKFKVKTRTIIEIIVNSISFSFLVLASWHIAEYAGRLYQKGEVSMTTKTPTYPFIYIIALGLSVFSLVILVQLIHHIKKVVTK